MLTIDIDARAMAELRGFALRIPLAVEAGLKNVGTNAQVLAAQGAAKIYARPIPRSRRGRPFWERSGKLLRELKKPLLVTKTKVEFGVDLNYAAARHGLGVDWMPRKPALGVIRKNPFMADARKQIEPKVGELFAVAFEKEFLR